MLVFLVCPGINISSYSETMFYFEFLLPADHKRGKQNGMGIIFSLKSSEGLPLSVSAAAAPAELQGVVASRRRVTADIHIFHLGATSNCGRLDTCTVSLTEDHPVYGSWCVSNNNREPSPSQRAATANLKHWRGKHFKKVSPETAANYARHIFQIIHGFISAISHSYQKHCIIPDGV